MSASLSERALILAPRGRDGAVAAGILKEADVQAVVCDSIADLLRELTVGAGIAVITDEALQTSGLKALSDWLEVQPPWSDFPFVLLTERGGGLERNPAAKRHLDILGNVTFIERPFHPTTLISLARSALRARRRQYDARGRMDELHESERQLRTLANSIPTLCWMARADGHIFWYNKQWFDYTGTTPDQMEGWGWQSVHDPATLPTVMDRWMASIESGESFEMVFPLRGADGRFRSFLTRVQPFRDADGAVVRWFGTNTDISVQQEAEQALRNYAADLENRVAERTQELQASERRLRTLFETSFMFQCLIGLDGRVIDANAASLSSIHSKLEDVVGAPIWEAPWVRETPSFAAVVRDRLGDIARGETLRRELTVHLSGRAREFDLSLRPMRDDDGSVVAVVMEAMDITERRLAEEALRQSQKLEAIGQLTGGVAHDFNNLLMPILGALDILQRRYTGKILDDRATTLMDGAIQSAERAKTLVQRLLGFARRQALETRAVDLSDLLLGMADLVKSSIGGGIELRMTTEDRAPAALADPNQLELAILNLCVNARDAMPEGGVLTVGLDQQTVTAASSVTGVAPGRYVRIYVRDTGEGMDAATLAHAVEPFFSTKPVGQGTGLGLSMVHGLVAQLGGGFRLESAPGEGTTTSLYLPQAEPMSLIVEAGSRPAVSEPAGRRLAILLVDDEDLVRSGTAEMLTELGHAVTEASDGAEALEKIGEGSGFDLLITDYKMPKMNGAELARRVRAIRPETPILLITGFADAETEAPDLTRLGKPFRQADLARALTKIAA